MSPGDQRGDVSQGGQQLTKRGMGCQRQARNTEQPASGGEQDAVLGDVDGVIVVADFKGHGEAEALAELVGFAQATTQERERFFDGAVALEHSMREGSAGCGVEGHGHRSDEVVDSGEVHDVVVAPAVGILGVAEEPQQPVDPDLRGDPKFDLVASKHADVRRRLEYGAAFQVCADFDRSGGGEPVGDGPGDRAERSGLVFGQGQTPHAGPPISSSGTESSRGRVREVVPSRRASRP